MYGDSLLDVMASCEKPPGPMRVGWLIIGSSGSSRQGVVHCEMWWLPM